MTCHHDIVARDIAITDGYCPLCLAALNAELVEALKRAEGFLLSYYGPEDRWILDDIRTAIAKAKETTWDDLPGSQDDSDDDPEARAT